MNKFYVAAQKMVEDLDSPNPHWAHPSLELAIEHAQRMLDDRPEYDAVAVVEVVRIVQRPRVETVEEYLKDKGLI